MKTSAGGGEGVFSSINTLKVKTVKTNFSKGLLPMLFLTLISIIEVKERRQLEMLQSFPFMARTRFTSSNMAQNYRLSI